MPVLFNKASGVHENLADDAASAALQSGTHEVPVMDANGEAGSVAPADFRMAQQQGARQPSPQELQGLLDKDKYESTPERLKTFGEGALSGSTFGLGNVAESALLGNSEQQLQRQKINPGTHMAGQAAGLVGSSLAGYGEGAALEALGSAVAPRAVTTLGRIGSAATKSAVENMVFQGADEASKAFMSDPEVTSTHFVQDVGLSGVLGAAFGLAGKGTSELWNATAGKKLGAVLDGLKGRAEPTIAERIEALGQNMQDSANQRMGDATNTLSDNMGTAAQGTMDATTAAGAANVNATNSVGQAITDAANVGADNAGAIGNATIDAINTQGQLTREALERQAQQKSALNELLERAKNGGQDGDAASAELLKKLGGIEGPKPELVAQANVEIPDSIRAALGDNADTRTKWALLNESHSSAANTVKRDLETFRGNLANGAQEALGLTPDDVKMLPNLSEHQVGKQVASHMQSGFQDMIDTVGPEFSEFHAKAADVPLNSDSIAAISNRLYEAAESEGWLKSPSSAEHALYKRVMTEIPLQENAKDLAKYTTLINADTERAEMWHAGSVIRKIFREETDNAIAAHLAANGGPELVAKFASARKSYGALMDLFDQYNQRLKLGNFNGPADFMSRLKELAQKPEALLKRVGTDADENLSRMLAEQMPEASKTINDYSRADLARRSLEPDRASVNVKKLAKNIDNMPPEFRHRVLEAGSAERIKAIETLERQIPERINKSGTAGTVMAMLGNMSASGVGMAATMASGPVGGATAFVLKKMADYVGKEAPDAITLATLKSLGSSMPTNPNAFRQMAAAAGAVIRGETLLNKAAKAVFSGAAKVVGEPSPKDIKKLKEHVDTAMNQPEKMLNVGGDLGHYMPEAGAALGQSTVQAVQYLASLRPHEEPLGPMDDARVPSAAEHAAYDGALRIAEQPLVILNDIRKGQLRPADVKHLLAMYPGMHQHIATKLMNEVINAKAAKRTVPYSTKLALGAFTGQPLDASMRQQSIAATQASFGRAPAPGPAGMPQAPKPPRANPKLETVADAYQTPQQRRVALRGGRP